MTPPPERNKHVASATGPAEARSLDPLVGLLQDRERTLQGLLAQLACEIQERQRISESLLTELDAERGTVNDELLVLRQWPISIDARFDRRRQRLEERHHNLQQERRQEVVERWRDVARLGREFRSWLKQHQDLIQKQKLLTPSEPGNARTHYDTTEPYQDP